MEDTTLTATPPAAPDESTVLAPNAGEGHTPLAYRLMPRASARVQLVLASIVWLVGASILLTRGVFYLYHSHWAAWLVALALVIGVAKGHLVLKRVASKGVDRIRVRGRDYCLFGFFSWKSWLLIGVMMGGGIMLRQSGAPPAFLGVLYMAVGTALIYGDHRYWLAAIGR